MYKVTILLMSFTLALITVAALITAGMLTGMLWLYILALWLSVLLLIIFLGFYFRAYRRVMTRTGTANERLSEIKLLQERRYELLAQRLDTLRRAPFTQPPGTTGSPSDFEYLIARAERAERRILGRLENIVLDNDMHFRTAEKLTPTCAHQKEPE